jgi:membrane protein involved in colicin uptake
VEVAAAPAVIGEVEVHAEEDGGEGGEARGSAAAAEDAAAEDAAAADAAAADAAAADAAVARAESLCSSSLRKALEEGQSAVTKCLTGNGVMLEEGLSVSVSVSVSGAGGASVEVTRLSLPSGVQLDAAVKQRVKGCVVDALKEVGVGCSVAASRSKKYAF